MSHGKEWLFSGDPLHQSVEIYLSDQLQGLTFAKNKLLDVEKQIQNLVREKENILYEIQIREANVEKTRRRMSQCKETIRERWFDIRKRYNIIGGDPLSLISLLPVELLVCIFKWLAPGELCKIMSICKFWREISVSDMVWSGAYQTAWGGIDEHICRLCSKLSISSKDDKKPPKSPSYHEQTINPNLGLGGGVKIGGQRLKEVTMSEWDSEDSMQIDTDLNDGDICKDDQKVSWFQAFIHRQQIEGNWQTGRCSIHTFVGHTDWVTCIAVHQSHLVSGSWDSFLKVWDLEGKVCLATLSGHTAGINDLDVHPEGNVLVSASLDCTLRVWDMTTYNCIWALEGHTDQVSFAKFYNSPPHIVSASLDGTLRLWNTNNGKCFCVLEGHQSGITAMCVQESLVVTGSTDGAMILWDLATRRKLHNLNSHSDRITSIQMDLKSQRIVSASWDATVKVWNIANGTCTRTLTGHIFRVRCVDFFGDTAVSGAWDNESKVWDLNTGECTKTLSGHASYVWATRLLSQRKRIITGSWDHSIRVWDLKSGQCSYTLDHTSEVLCMETSSHRLIGASKDIRVWDFSPRN